MADSLPWSRLIADVLGHPYEMRFKNVRTPSVGDGFGVHLAYHHHMTFVSSETFGESVYGVFPLVAGNDTYLGKFRNWELEERLADGDIVVRDGSARAAPR